MATVTAPITSTGSRSNPAPASWRPVWVLMRREMIDTLRDWRIVIPILILTLLFPVLMDFTADQTLRFVEKWGAPIVGERLIPFLLMIVGFFPISFSLIIALETFVGEKERKSLEPLLASPLSDLQLYVGKMLAAVIPPLVAAYLGISVYLVGLWFTVGWLPSPLLLIQILALTTVEGIVMVSAAVVISSQTTSVRAANLLASFIIIPMSLLVQAESIIMFWARYDVLWWVVVFLSIVDVVLIRTGVVLFNREQLLGQEIDDLNLGRVWRTFWRHLLGADGLRGLSWRRLPAARRRALVLTAAATLLVTAVLGALPDLRLLGPAALCAGLALLGAIVIGRAPFRRTWPAILLAVLAIVGAGVVGWRFAVQFQLPPSALDLDSLTAERFAELPAVDWLPSFTVWGILANNVRALLLAGLLAIFSFGTLAVALLMAPLAIVAFFAAQAGWAGYSPWLFLLAFIVPHGLLELPAAVLATGMGVRLGAVLLSAPKGDSVSDQWLQALADFIKTFVLVVLPLLVGAAWIEVHVTYRVVLWAFGS